MRKIVSICLLLALLLSTVICVQAAGTNVVFAAGSTFAVGGTATVDFLKTSQKVMDDPNVMADMYNAALEQDMGVTWICSNGTDKKGTSVTWAAEDAGKEYVCRVGFYADDALTEFIDYIDSDPFVISGGQAEEAEITTKGPIYFTEGVAASYQLKCNVSGVTFGLFRTSLPKGMTLSESGLISGTPTEAGFVFATVAVYKNDEMIGSEGFEIYVQEPTPGNQYESVEVKITTTKLPEAAVGEKYYVKLKCTDPDAEFSEWYNPGKANDLGKTGLTLAKNGELGGKPSKAGTYTFCVCASGEAGEDYMTYTLVVKDASEETVVVATDPAETVTEPEEITENGETTEALESTAPAETTGQKDQKEKDKDKVKEPVPKGMNGNIWIYVGAGLGVLIAGMAVGIVLLLKSKKKP